MQQSQVTSGAQSFGAIPFASFPAPQVDVCWLAWDGTDLWISEDGNAYAMLSSLVAGGGWQDDGAVVRLVSAADVVSIGVAVPPAGQKLYVEGTADAATESVLEADFVGQPVAGAGTDGGAGVRVVRTRSAAAADFWMSSFSAAPLSFAADVGVEVAFHAEPPTEALGSKIAFMIEGTRTANVYTVGLQAYEHELLARTITFTAGNGFPLTLLGCDAFLNGTGGEIVITAGDAESTDAAARVGGDIELRPGLAAGGGVDGSVRVIPQIAAQVPLVIGSFAAQTGNRQEWQDRFGDPILFVDNLCNVHLGTRNPAGAGDDSIDLQLTCVTTAGAETFAIRNEGSGVADTFQLVIEDLLSGDRLLQVASVAGATDRYVALGGALPITRFSVGSGIAPQAGALVDLVSTDSLFVPPNMTTAEAAAIAVKPNGGMYYDTTLSKLRVWTGAAYETITSV